MNASSPRPLWPCSPPRPRLRKAFRYGRTDRARRRKVPRPISRVPCGSIRFGGAEQSKVTAGHVTFEPGSRAAWHTHPAGQVLIVTFGSGWVQEWGQSKREIQTGDVVWIAPGVKHWHGATDKTGMSHLAITEPVDGKNVLLGLGELSDEFHVVAVDRPGHGMSSRKPLHASLWRQTEVIREVALRLKLTRPVIVGHSYGGAIALAYGMLFPDDVAGIVALAPICLPEFRLEHVLFGPRATPVVGKHWAAWADKSTDRILLPTLWRTMFKPQTMPDAFERHYPFRMAGRTTRSPLEGEESMALWADLTRSGLQYAGLRARVAIMGGDRDIVVNNGLHGRVAASLIPGAIYENIPGSGHMLHHFFQPRVVEHVRAFARAEP